MRDRKNDTTHRQIASRAAGRKLTPNEVAHHLDEDKSNNASSNLLVESRSAHTKRHNRTRSLGRLRKALTMAKRGERLY